MKTPSPHLYYKLFAFICLLAVAGACSKEDDPAELGAPVAADATDITGTGFLASWSAVANATGYEVDISTDNFTTFANGYESKSVTETTEAVTGLTAGVTYKYRVRSVNANGVSANSNEISVTTTFGTIANVNGTAFTPTGLTLTDTNVGLELRMKNGTHDITLRLSDKTAGTYEFLSTLSTGRTAAVKTAIAFWVSNGETFYGESGDVTVGESNDKLVITFNATGKSDDGSSSTIANGKLENVVATPAGVGQCSLATYSLSDSDQEFDGAFGYDNEGRLIQFVADGTTWNYFWVDSRITKALFYDEYEVRDETWTYEDDVLTGITGISAGVMGAGTFEITYTYTGGKLTKAVREDFLNDVPFTYTNNISYVGDNVVSVGYEVDFFGSVIESYAIGYSEYDVQNNFWRLLAESTNNPLPIGFSSSVSGEMLSKNNVGMIITPAFSGMETETFIYQNYNIAGYPASLAYTWEGGGLNDSYSAAMTYTGCN